MAKRQIKKRYSLREEILREISDAEWMRDISIKLAGQYRAKGDEHRDWLASHPAEQIKTDAQSKEFHSHNDALVFCREKEKLKIASHRRAEIKLSKLKAALQQFDTQPMPFLEDCSIKA